MTRLILSLCILMLSTQPGSAFAASIYVYKNTKGQLYFTDAPMQNKGYQLISTQHKGGDKQKSWNSNGRKKDDVTTQYDSYISQAAHSYRLDPSLIKAVIHAESYFNTFAVSSAGAQGLMQLMPTTANQYRIDNPHNPKQNILAGCQHLSYLLTKYRDDLDLALAAYNAGETIVTRYKGIPPYEETINYVKKVKRLHRQYSLGI